MVKTGRRCWLQAQIRPDRELRGTARLTAAALTVLALLLNLRPLIMALVEQR
jgi:hypothetical protein